MGHCIPMMGVQRGIEMTPLLLGVERGRQGMGVGGYPTGGIFQSLAMDDGSEGWEVVESSTGEDIADEAKMVGDFARQGKGDAGNMGEFEMSGGADRRFDILGWGLKWGKRGAKGGGGQEKRGNPGGGVKNFRKRF
eukprot:760543-Hanusia_phi.AAC.5